MQKAAAMYLVLAVALCCLALATTTINCGGTSGERPGGTGGTTSTGGTSGGGAGGGGAGGGAVGTGGSTNSVNSCTTLDCTQAIEPDNIDVSGSAISGFVTDFSDYSTLSGKFGGATKDNLLGSPYHYPGPNSTMSHKIEGTPVGLHLTGSVAANDYGGGGISFCSCAKVPDFTQIQFTISGSSLGCDLELQIQTFDQRPTSQTPPGGCDSSTTSCYGFPVVKQVVDVSTAAITTPMTVTKALADFSNWSTANANQVVGLQWQFTGTKIDPDAGAGCPIDVTITNIKFLP
jgi:hypothetical protein